MLVPVLVACLAALAFVIARILYGLLRLNAEE